jgi:ribonuclease P protein component
VKIPCLNKRQDFLNIKRFGKKFVSQGFVMQAIQHNEDGAFQFGLIVTKKLGCAVKRNLIKRRFRAIIQQHIKEKNVPAYKFVIIARIGCLTTPFEELEVAFKKGFYFFKKQT